MQQDRQVSQHERRIARRYMLELGGSIALYIALMAVSALSAEGMQAGALKTALAVLPMAGFLLMIWAIARQVQRMDEYVRRQVLETIAISAAVTAGATFTYGFLESAGYPRLSMFTVWGVMGGSAALASLIRCKMCRQ
ncbi:hypothetical protein GCM10027277_05900 [Pseudoduganella ginsengisoli]|uniref:Uncharacterized protein n=1 Tax=Pseudoduganella ginsengisoli TaxID=1462440 RepID=A0A6L6Q4A4_9BURK|nr:hypothetical protein [Pseudoduganella ginsengisoli]MTW04289.1 hypothetical protein [Pseudoduganella ginsengisoli]